MVGGGGEIENFIKVWTSIFISLIYCHAVPSSIPKGPKRLISVLPVVVLFLYLPLCLSSVHLGGTTAFFVAWLANFKLLLFAFGKGPLISNSDNPRDLSLPLFIAISCLPIRIRRAPAAGEGGRLNYTVKALSVGVLIRVYDYSDRIHPNVLLTLYGFHVYFMLDLIFAAAAAAVRRVGGLELEPMFDAPYRSTSLQDFWGRRWNLSVTRILRPAVYDPVRWMCAPAWWAPLPAVFGTFVVSAAMHEMIFYYMGGRVGHTWESTWFFLLHGACLTVEIAAKTAGVGTRWRLPPAVSWALTVGFVFATANWLFFPKFVQLKVDVKAFEEYAAVGEFARSLSRRVFNFPVAGGGSR